MLTRKLGKRCQYQFFSFGTTRKSVLTDAFSMYINILSIITSFTVLLPALELINPHYFFLKIVVTTTLLFGIVN